MPTLTDLSTTQLRQAFELSEQIDSLQERLKAILSGSGSTASPSKTPEEPETKSKTRKGMSPATRAKMRAAQQARWAKIKGPSTDGAEAIPVPTKKRRGLTAEGRARLAAAMKARWAARKKGAPAPNSAH